jgi:glutamyl-tRNA synthetase
MPSWAHLPLILKPDGNGKLSKRDGDRLGFPVFAMNWTDPKSGELSRGFRELGFLPEAFVNMLAMLGWNDGTGQELFSLDELVARFSIDRVHKGGAKFDFEKAKWYNHEWIKRMGEDELYDYVVPYFNERTAPADKTYVLKVIGLIRDRCTLLTEFWDQGFFFFEHPAAYDLAAIQPKWNEKNKVFFEMLALDLGEAVDYDAALLETTFKALATAQGIKPGELQMLFRVMLVGGKFGPGVFEIAALLGKEGTVERIRMGISAFSI